MSMSKNSISPIEIEAQYPRLTKANTTTVGLPAAANKPALLVGPQQTTPPTTEFEFSEPIAQTSRGMDMEIPEGVKKWAFPVLVVVAAAIVILIPLSFSDLHYYEMGFSRNKFSGSVDTSKVYTGGRYFLGLANEFKKFRADMHYERFEKVSIFNKEKLEVLFSCSLLYKLRPDHLKKLHDTYDLEYKPVIRSTTLAALKGIATRFAIDEYRLEREKVRDAFALELAQQLGGNCCDKNSCKICPPGCQEISRCTDPGLFVDLRYFHLHMVGITQDQHERYMKQVVESEKEDTELYKQDESMKRKETEELRDKVNNEAKEIAEKASADSNLIRSNATIEGQRITSDAANRGLQIIYAKLNISSEEHKKTMDYVRTLTNKKEAKLYVGFSTNIANSNQKDGS